jgi:hypothetical protein
MKKGLLIIVASLSVLSCDDDIAVPDPAQRKLFNKWNLLEYTGGIAGTKVEGYGKSIEFTSKGVYKEYEYGHIVERVNYSIEEARSIYSTNKSYQITYQSGSLHNQTFNFKGDTLFLADELFDGYTYVYIKGGSSAED